ncbi:ATP-binding protein [Isoptericola sp. F-RaC21]|uniref:ATP-binding protein n=1 Tax=Isoptericola sp. F-RaC21 TaxID=3141452 RepID=UPI00315BD93F
MSERQPSGTTTDGVATPEEQHRKLLWPKLGPYPTEVRQTIRVLAEILGAPRRPKKKKPTTASGWAAHKLGVKKARMSEVKRDLSDAQLLLHGHVLAGWMKEHEGAVKILGPHGSTPEWRPLSLGEDHTVSVPFHLSVFFPAGTLRDEPIVIHICGGHPADVTVYTGEGRRDLAEAVLDDFLAALKGEGNPYRGRILQVSVSSYGNQVGFEPVPATHETRADLVLSDAVWAEVDLFLSSGTTRRADLLSLGLPTTRGLLLAGKPGVGKTKLGRILAAEVAGAMTVMIVEPDVLRQASENLYKEVERLGPTLVVMEDIDGVANAEMRSSSGFSEFLNALDGARVRNDVLTLATTNDPGSLDPAVKRPGRFDTILEVPLPSQEGRVSILEIYLPRQGEGLDLGAIAGSLDGATGAEIREVARRAVLEHGIDGMTTRRILDITATGRWKPSPAVGHYL